MPTNVQSTAIPYNNGIQYKNPTRDVDFDYIYSFEGKEFVLPDILYSGDYGDMIPVSPIRVLFPSGYDDYTGTPFTLKNGVVVLSYPTSETDPYMLPRLNVPHLGSGYLAKVSGRWIGDYHNDTGHVNEFETNRLHVYSPLSNQNFKPPFIIDKILHAELAYFFFKLFGMV
jgi:hypothetical protein